MVLRADDPWWDTHFPANGWGCQCYVEGLTQEEVDELGINDFTAPAIVWENRVIGKNSPNGARTVKVPKGISPGFEYTPGKARLENAVPPWKPIPPFRGSEGLPNNTVNDPLPPPDKLAFKKLPEAKDGKEYANAFLSQFGTSYNGDPVVFEDVLGSRLVVGSSLFDRRGKSEGLFKGDKGGRGRYMQALAMTIKEPDEIWSRVEYHHSKESTVVRKRYIKRFILDGEEVEGLAVFEHGKDGWDSKTIFNITQHDLEDIRVGVRLYKRK